MQPITQHALPGQAEVCREQLAHTPSLSRPLQPLRRPGLAMGALLPPVFRPQLAVAIPAVMKKCGAPATYIIPLLALRRGPRPLQAGAEIAQFRLATLAKRFTTAGGGGYHAQCEGKNGQDQLLNFACVGCETTFWFNVFSILWVPPRTVSPKPMRHKIRQIHPHSSCRRYN